MAITKCLHMKQAKSGYPAKHLANGLRYIMDPRKTEQGRYVGGNLCIPEQAITQMLDTKRSFGKIEGRQGYHFIISFEQEEVSEEKAFEVVGEFVKEFLRNDFEAVYAIHNDTDHMHGHIIFNSVRCSNGYKYDYRNGDWEHIVQPITNRICQKHGLSTLDLEEVKEKRHKKWKEQKQERVSKTIPIEEKNVSKREGRLRADVDRAVEDADTYEAFLENLRCMGYELRGKKRISIREPGAERGRRLDQLGEAYTEEMLRCRIGKPLVLTVPELKPEPVCKFVFIPYKSRHLTRYQKERFMRRYREGKPQADNRTWKYKKSLQALKKLQEEFDFLAEQRLVSKEQLEGFFKTVREELRENSDKKWKLQSKILPYEAIRQLLREIEDAEMEAGLYLEGYPEFEAEYQRYQGKKAQLLGLGYSIADAVNMDSYFVEAERQLREERKELLKKKRIAERLYEKTELYRQEKERTEKLPDNSISAKSRGMEVK